jgi:hypothetical protein
MTTEKTHEKLRKLKAMADSAKKIGNEAEAQAFAEMLTKLMAAHNVEMSDVEWEQERKLEAVELEYCLGKSKVMLWEARLASIVAEGNFCRVLLRRNWSATFVVFVGLAVNVEAALQTMAYLHPAAKRIAQNEYDKKYNALLAAHADKHCMLGYRKDFLLGFVSRLHQRYTELRESMRSAAAGCAIIRLTDALTVANQAMEKKSLRKGTQYQSGNISNTQAYMDGKRKADEMNVGGPSLHRAAAEQPSANHARLSRGF